MSEIRGLVTDLVTAVKKDVALSATPLPLIALRSEVQILRRNQDSPQSASMLAGSASLGVCPNGFVPPHR